MIKPDTNAVTVLAEYMNEARLVHDTECLWIENHFEGQCAFLPIEDADLIELGRKLQTLGRKLAKAKTTE